MCTDEQHALNRQILPWKAMTIVLEEFLELDSTESTSDSFLYVGNMPFGAAGEMRSVFAVPLLWLAGTCSCDALCCTYGVHRDALLLYSVMCIAMYT